VWRRLEARGRRYLLYGQLRTTASTVMDWVA
jgi:hypothetical protein